MSSKKAPVLLGAHMSIGGGYYQAIERGASIGCTAIQIFTKSNRQWKASPITSEEAHKFKITWEENPSIHSIIAHATYLINLASPNLSTRKNSITAVIDELKRCEQLGISSLVVHPGAHVSATREEGLLNVSRSLDEIFNHYAGKTNILLEIMAGQGSTLGATFEEIAFIRKNTGAATRAGVCFDTCHAFCAGYDFSTSQSYNAVWESFDKIIGLEHLHAIHLNDSKKALGTHLDRHEHIGKGLIPLSAFSLLLNDEKFIHIPKILETPKESLADDEANIKVLLKLIK